MTDVHALKTAPVPFAAVMRGHKTFEIRYDDRGYKLGDRLILRELREPVKESIVGEELYTGRTFEAEITYIVRAPRYGLKGKWCVMSFKAVA